MNLNSLRRRLARWIYKEVSSVRTTELLNITYLIELLASHEGRAPGYVGKLVANSGDFYMRLKNGRGITVRRAVKVTQKLSDQWPADLPWPLDIPRPAPD